MTATVYGKPFEGGICTVIDFTSAQAPLLTALPRATRSSRTPGHVNRGTVYSRRVTLKRCGDCGRVVDGGCEAGRHSVLAVGGVWRNCVGKEVASL